MVTKRTGLDAILGPRVGGVRVIPINLKIVALFVVFLLLSNLVTNYINLTFTRNEQIRLTTDALVRDLKDLYGFSATQFKVFAQSTADPDVFTFQMGEFARSQFKNRKSLAVGVGVDGVLGFAAGPGEADMAFAGSEAMETARSAHAAGTNQGPLNFVWNGERYFGVYRYNADWDMFLIRAEEWNEFFEPTVRIMTLVTGIIVTLTVIMALIGAWLLRYLLRFVGKISARIMEMQESQEMQLIDMNGAPNDDVTYLGMAMNSLSSTIQNLVEIFRKFVARDVASEAYRKREIRLEGEKRNLAIMFSDIKGFTFMTETLGTEIITLINMHYGKAIRAIHQYNGDVGSIIGDAILAVFGTMTRPGENKAIEAIRAGYTILQVAEELRADMDRRKMDWESQEGPLPDPAVRVYEAVRLQVGVGIDGGEVFYGNIGSNERMVNTVIGDNVNSSSRLEGLTRIYGLPMIVSESIRDEVVRESDEYVFMEIDMVQVKGKTLGKRIFAPLLRANLGTEELVDIRIYEDGLARYYEGDWPTARDYLSRSRLPPAKVLLARIEGSKVPTGWNGIWTMKEK